MGLKRELVLADSLYEESDVNFVSVLHIFNLNYLVAIHSNHGVWVLKGQNFCRNKLRKFEIIFSDNRRKTRYIREIIFGKRRQQQFWQITTDIETLSDNSTWYTIAYIPGVKSKEIGHLFGFRTWEQLLLFLIRKSSLVDRLLVSADKLLERNYLYCVCVLIF